MCQACKLAQTMAEAVPSNAALAGAATLLRATHGEMANVDRVPGLLNRALSAAIMAVLATHPNANLQAEDGFEAAGAVSLLLDIIGVIGMLWLPIAGKVTAESFTGLSIAVADGDSVSWEDLVAEMRRGPLNNNVQATVLTDLDDAIPDAIRRRIGPGDPRLN